MQKIKRYSSVSIVLIVLCGIVALLSRLGEARGVLVPLFIANPASEGLSDILHGQVWRLVTPMFIHFGIMHFVFNMMWVWDLGKLIQAKKGAGFYIVFVLVVASLSNLAQYLLPIRRILAACRAWSTACLAISGYAVVMTLSSLPICPRPR